MTEKEYIEFIAMLLLEQSSYKWDKLKEYVVKHCDPDKFNARYMKLLDKFLNQYAIDTTEKSE